MPTLEEINEHNDVLDVNASNDTIVKDSQQDAIEKLAKEYNLRLDDATKDALLQYIMQEKSADSAYHRSVAYNKEYPSALVEGLQKAGINPFLAMSSISGASLQNGAGSTGGLYTSRANTQTNKSSNVDRGLMSVLAIIAAAVIGAIL